MDWEAKRTAYRALVAEREARACEPDPDAGRADFQVAALATACWAAGVAGLMTGRDGEAAASFRRAAEVYRSSFALAPPGSWGRPLAALRCRLLGGDVEGAAADAEWALAEGAAVAESAVGRYTAALALLVLRRDAEARPLAEGLVAEGALEPRSVSAALAALASGDATAYVRAVDELIDDFEGRTAFLEDVAAADTVLVLDRLAADRGLERPARPSPLLPPA